MRARLVDQNTAHHLRGDAEELSAVLPDRSVLIDESQVGFVNQRGWLEGMVWALMAKVLGGPPPKFLVHERDQRVTRGDVAFAPGAEQFGHVEIGRTHGCRRGHVRWPAGSSQGKDGPNQG